jgi:hypothetical protein
MKHFSNAYHLSSYPEFTLVQHKMAGAHLKNLHTLLTQLSERELTLNLESAPDWPDYRGGRMTA